MQEENGSEDCFRRGLREKDDQKGSCIDKPTWKGDSRKKLENDLDGTTENSRQRGGGKVEVLERKKKKVYRLRWPPVKRSTDYPVGQCPRRAQDRTLNHEKTAVFRMKARNRRRGRIGI